MSSEQVENRIRSIIQNAISMGATRGLGVVISLAMVPLTLGYLGPERYGFWMALSSLIAFLQISDMGIGNALIGQMASRQAKGESFSLPGMMTTALLILAIGGALLVGIFFVFADLINWRSLLNYSTAVDSVEVADSARAFLIMFAIGLPLSVAQQIRTGMLQGRLNGIYLTIGQLCNLLFVGLAIYSKSGLPVLVVASMLGTLIGAGANLMSILIDFRKIDEAAWRPNFINASLLIKKGGLFLVLQGCALISYNSDNLIVSHILGAGRVAEYSIAMKIFSLPALLLSLFYVGMWPAYADAEARGEIIWARNFFWKTIKQSLMVSCVVSILLFIFSPFIFGLLSHGAVNPEPLLLYGMVIWGCYLAIGGSFAALLNGMHIVRFQVFLAVFFMVINICVSVFLTKNIGISGPIFGSVFALTFQYGIIFLFIKNKVFKAGLYDAG